jgi:hypothetical protein
MCTAHKVRGDHPWNKDNFPSNDYKSPHFGTIWTDSYSWFMGTKYDIVRLWNFNIWLCVCLRNVNTAEDNSKSEIATCADWFIGI